MHTEPHVGVLLLGDKVVLIWMNFIPSQGV